MEQRTRRLSELIREFGSNPRLLSAVVTGQRNLRSRRARASVNHAKRVAQELSSIRRAATDKIIAVKLKLRDNERARQRLIAAKKAKNLQLILARLAASGVAGAVGAVVPPHLQPTPTVKPVASSADSGGDGKVRRN